MTQINRKFTEQECVANGGHFWRYWKANDFVDDNFRNTNPNLKHLVYFPNGEPEYRGCPLCGRVEQHIVIDSWEKSKCVKL